MRADDLLRLLGAPATDNSVRAMLRDFGLTAEPALATDIPADEQDWCAWLTSGASGVEFGFMDEAYFLAQERSFRGTRPLLLTQIYFYCRHEGIERYRGDLPFGLKDNDSRADVRRKLQSLAETHRFHIRDVWELAAIRMVVAYAVEDAAIASIFCTLPLRSWPSLHGEARGLPRPAQFVNALRQSVDSVAIRELGGALGLTLAGEEEWDLLDVCGLDLRFMSAPVAAPGPRDFESRSLTTVQFYRDRELDAHGWRGELPYSLRFDDPPGALAGKVGRAPDESHDSDLVGFALWKFTEFSLHVMYSNVENFILRVTLRQLVDEGDEEDPGREDDG